MKQFLTTAVIGAFLCTVSIASAATFNHVCLSAMACDGDAEFSFSISLDDRVITPGGTYNTSADGGAALLGWRATSSVGDGFTIFGGMSEVSGASRLTFTFDASRVLSGIEETGSGLVFAFENAGVGRIRFQEPRIFRDRTDYGATTVFDGTDIVAEWRVMPDLVALSAVPEVPLPASVLLLLAGIGALAFGRGFRRTCITSTLGARS